MFTSELARRLNGSGVTAHCFHPGLVASGFNRNNGLLMNLAMTILAADVAEPGEGGGDLVWLATSPEAEIVNGGYYFDKECVLPSPKRRTWTRLGGYGR